MPALAPTSMPRVGSSKIRICGRVSSHLASTTFCWLPPDRKRTSCSGPRARSSVTAASSLTLIRPWVRRRRRAPGITVRTASSMLSAIDCASARPSSLRSSVMKPRPARIAARGVLKPHRLAVDLDRCRRRPGRRRRSRARARCGPSPGARPGRRSRRRAPARLTSRSSVGRHVLDREPHVAEVGRARRAAGSSRRARARPSGSRARASRSRTWPASSTSAAVLEHGDAVREREDLAQAVRDVEHPDAPLLQAPHEREQQLDLVVGERGGRLVEHEDARVERARLDDLDDLLLGDRQAPRPASAGRS